MPNLVLTYRCNDQCAYCFGAARQDTPDLTVGRVKQLLPLLESMNKGSINIVGGEPTMNRDFVAILDFLLGKGFQVHIFTNGRISQRLLGELQMMQEGSFTFCVNRSTVPLPLEVIELYRRMGYKVHLAATVHQVDQSLDHVLDEIDAYHLERHYRIGIALPVWRSRENVFVETKDYPLVGEQLFAFVERGVEQGITPFFDCGFPYCFFDAEQRDFFQRNRIEFRSSCTIIPDICPGARVIPCFPLAELGVTLSDGAAWEEVRGRLENCTRSIRDGGIFAECGECHEIQAAQCSGGCRAVAAISHTAHEEIGSSVHH